MIRKIKDTNSFYIYEEGNKVGNFTIIKRAEGHLGFWNFDIYPEFRDKGYGKKSLLDLIKRLVKLSIKTLWLYVDKTNLKALHIYNKCGFEIINETVWNYQMQINLTKL